MKSSITIKTALCVAVLAGLLVTAASAQVLVFGDQDALGTGAYGASDPTAGATLQGLAPGVVTQASLITGHSFPFSPGVGDFAGTDQIYVGSTQTGFHDGYSAAAERLNGPQVFSLDYSSLVPSGSQIATFTLGIAADDFQFPSFGQAFTASINGTFNTALTTTLNSLSQGGPVTQFFAVGIDPTSLAMNHILTLAINQEGDGGDGWAVDFLTTGVTTRTMSLSSVPEPATVSLWSAFGLLALVGFRLRSQRQSKET